MRGRRADAAEIRGPRVRAFGGGAGRFVNAAPASAIIMLARRFAARSTGYGVISQFVSVRGSRSDLIGERRPRALELFEKLHLPFIRSLHVNYAGN